MSNKFSGTKNIKPHPTDPEYGIGVCCFCETTVKCDLRHGSGLGGCSKCPGSIAYQFDGTCYFCKAECEPDYDLRHGPGLNGCGKCPGSISWIKRWAEICKKNEEPMTNL